MGHPAEKRATYEDLLGLPDNVVGQLIEGSLVVTPRPGSKHAHATSRLGVRLGSSYDFGDDGGPGGWWILDEPELHLADNVLVPDLAGWRRERMPRMPDAPYFTSAPDWVCEVVSFQSAGVDRVRKMPIYAASNVGFIWLIDPHAKTLEVYRVEAGRLILSKSFSNDEIAKAEPFERMALKLSELWTE